MDEPVVTVALSVTVPANAAAATVARLSRALAEHLGDGNRVERAHVDLYVPDADEGGE